jgi:hypothetical protein
MNIGDWQAVGVLSNMVLLGILVLITLYYAWQTQRQTSSMQETMRLALLVKRHERLEKELKRLIGLLHSRKEDKTIFGPSEFGKKLEERGYYPFWDNINENLHLAPEELGILIRDYINFIQRGYFEIDETDQKLMLDDKSKEVILQVESRYRHLRDAIENLEEESGCIGHRLGPKLRSEPLHIDMRI